MQFQILIFIIQCSITAVLSECKSTENVILEQCTTENTITSGSIIDDIKIDPFHVREEGCPMVADRNGLDLSRVSSVLNI